jgi:large subunit ribosomal protein L24
MSGTPSKLRKGDTVVVISGKNKGATGTVQRIDHARNRIVVEGVNIVKKHRRARLPGETSRILQEEAALHASNVMLVDADGNRSRVAYTRDADGKKGRVARSNGQAI